MPDAEPVPDVYADQFIVTTTLWGAALSFSKMPPHPAPGQPPQGMPQAVIRMSMHHAKVMAMILKRSIKNWERENGEIHIPPAALNQMGLSPEDWA